MNEVKPTEGFQLIAGADGVDFFEIGSEGTVQYIWGLRGNSVFEVTYNPVSMGSSATINLNKLSGTAKSLSVLGSVHAVSVNDRAYKFNAETKSW
jgi:hypothetical protein